MTAADALVGRLPRTILVVGKGGVGKTTCAAALALCASRSQTTLVLSTDPARALPTVLDAPVGSSPAPVPAAPRLSAQVLDAAALRATFMRRWRNVIREILDRGTYLDDSDIDPLVDTAMPGSDEIFAALELAALLASDPDSRDVPARIVIDTAPTGHTLRLLNLPATFKALVRLLETMQAKHRFMVRTLTRTYRPDAADAFLADMERIVRALDDALRDSGRCVAVMVANAQPLVIEETRRYLRALQELRVVVGAIIWNASDAAPREFTGTPQFLVPRLRRWPVGREGLEGWLRELRPLRSSDRPRKDTRQVVSAGVKGPAADVSALLRPLTIVAGKGGVGKTTVSAALAVRSALDARTLVVSTDPAPSLSDALVQDIADADTPIDRVPNLFGRQMDASAAFARLRADYQDRVDALFEGLIARGVDLAHDRAIAKDLLSLAPPGIDEVYALSLVATALLANNYERVIVDPAPTGHLLRLLEMPQLALQWSHQLLRLMLKYKEVSALGDAARDLLAFAKDVRAVDTLLGDGGRSAAVLVTLDEPVVLAETTRLAEAIASRRVAISGIVTNRGRGARATALPDVGGAMHFEAPSIEPPPMGVRALREWLERWR